MRMRQVSLVAATIVGLLLLPGCSHPDKQNVKVENYSVDSAITALVIKGQVGDIVVTGAAGAVEVVEHQSYREKAPVTSHLSDNGRLTLGYACSAADCGVSYDVRVPTGTLVTISEDVGNVDVRGVSGDVDVSDQTGNITGRELRAQQVKLRVETGQLDAGFSSAPRSLDARVNIGNVTVTVPKGESYAVQAAAGIGDVHVGVDRDATSSHSLWATTSTGDVRIKT